MSRVADTLTDAWEVRAWSCHAKTTVVRANPEYVTGVEVIAECAGSGQMDTAECERRALLISAAKEMQEALTQFAKYACDTPHVDEPMCHNCRARAALAKANGGAA